MLASSAIAGAGLIQAEGTQPPEKRAQTTAMGTAYVNEGQAAGITAAMIATGAVGSTQSADGSIGVHEVQSGGGLRLNSGYFGELPSQSVRLVADFTASPVSGTLPLTVTFSNLSTGVYTSTIWRFGDGGRSTITNPVHTYTGAGAYTVGLTVRGPDGEDTAVRANYITVLGNADLFLSPLSSTVGVGQTFTVAIGVLAGAQEVDSAAAHLDFDPAVLQVVDASNNLTTTIEHVPGALGASAAKRRRQ